MKLAIDFGSTFTYIYQIDDSGKITRFSTENYYMDLKACYRGIPTNIGVGSKDSALWGDLNDTEKEMFQFGGLKQALRNNKVNSNTDTDKIKKFFMQIFRNLNRSGVSHVYLGTPACGEDTDTNEEYTQSSAVTEYENFINGIIKEIFPNAKITILREPEAAAYAACSAGIIEKDKNTMIVDIGGGTLDFSTIYWEKNKPIISDAEYAGELGGDFFDNIVLYGNNNFNERGIIQCYSGQIKSNQIIIRTLLAAKEMVLDSDYLTNNKLSMKIFSDNTELTAKYENNHNSFIDEQQKILYFSPAIRYYANEIAEKIIDYISRKDHNLEIDSILCVGNGSCMQPLIDIVKSFLRSNTLTKNRKVQQVNVDKDIAGFPERPNAANLIALGLALYLRDPDNKKVADIKAVEPNYYFRITYKKSGKRNGSYAKTQFVFNKYYDGKYAVTCCFVKNKGDFSEICIWDVAHNTGVIPYQDYRKRKRWLFCSLRENNAGFPKGGFIGKDLSDRLINGERCFFVIFIKKSDNTAEVFFCPEIEENDVKNFDPNNIATFSVGNDCYCIDCANSDVIFPRDAHFDIKKELNQLKELKNA